MSPRTNRFFLAALVVPFGLMGSAGAEQPPNTITPIPEVPVVPVPQMPGDYNSSCVVEFGDLSYVLADFAPRGVYGMSDVQTILAHFGERCGDSLEGKQDGQGPDDSAPVAAE